MYVYTMYVYRHIIRPQVDILHQQALLIASRTLRPTNHGRPIALSLEPLQILSLGSSLKNGFAKSKSGFTRSCKYLPGRGRSCVKLSRARELLYDFLVLVVVLPQIFALFGMKCAGDSSQGSNSSDRLIAWFIVFKRKSSQQKRGTLACGSPTSFGSWVNWMVVSCSGSSVPILQSQFQNCLNFECSLCTCIIVREDIT